jgi:hypothetical protein
MAVVTRVPMRSLTHLRNLLAYFQNGDHPNHHVHRIHAAKDYGTVTTHDIANQAVKALSAINRSGKKGRKLTTLAHYIMARFLPGTDMSPEENSFYDKGMAEGLVGDGGLVSTQHENWVLHASDFNYVVSGWEEYPLRARRSNEDDLLKNAQNLSNRLIKEMNVRRLAKGRATIVSAKVRKKELARKKRGAWIEEELAEVMRSKSVNLENLAVILTELGHTVVVATKQKKPRKKSLAQKIKDAAKASKIARSDRISLVPRGRKKAIRLSKISLLQACYAIARQISAKNQEIQKVDLQQAVESHVIKFPIQPPIQQPAPPKPIQQPPSDAPRRGR